MTLDDKVAPDNAAVLVIDVQNDFIAEGGFADAVGWPRSGNAEAARRLVPFLGEAREAGVPIVFVQAIYDEAYLGAPMLERNIRRGVTQPRCQSGSWGAEFYLVRPGPGELVVRKHRYSAFAETELNTVLRHLNIQTLILTGVYTEGCVESTGRDGYFLDYYIVLVEDCTGTTSVERHLGALERCEADWGQVATSADVVSCWRGPGPRPRESSTGA